MRGFLSRLGSSYWPVVAMIVALGFILWGVVAHAEEPAEPEPRVMSERCEAWIAWLVDGNAAIWVRVPSVAFNHVARDCLGREANPLTRSPIPPPPAPKLPAPIEPDAENSPEPEPVPTSENPKLSI